jgi:hypothetical protein
MLRPVVVTAAAVWATCTKKKADCYKEATRKGGFFALWVRRDFRSLGRQFPFDRGEVIEIQTLRAGDEEAIVLRLPTGDDLTGIFGKLGLPAVCTAASYRKRDFAGRL